MGVYDESKEMLTQPPILWIDYLQWFFGWFFHQRELQGFKKVVAENSSIIFLAGDPGAFDDLVVESCRCRGCYHDSQIVCRCCL